MRRVLRQVQPRARDRSLETGDSVALPRSLKSDWNSSSTSPTRTATRSTPPPGIPRNVRHVITFKGVADGKTKMTVTEYGYTSDEVIDISKAGLEQSLDKMAASFAQAQRAPGRGE